jgi:hypothetical protein
MQQTFTYQSNKPLTSFLNLYLEFDDSGQLSTKIYDRIIKTCCLLHTFVYRTDQYHILTKVLIIVWYLFLVSPYSTVTKHQGADYCVVPISSLKGVFRSRKLKDWNYIGQKKMDKQRSTKHYTENYR